MLHTNVRGNRSTQKILKVCYDLRAWRSSWSRDLGDANKFSFPLSMEAANTDA